MVFLARRVELFTSRKVNLQLCRQTRKQRTQQQKSSTRILIFYGIYDDFFPLIMLCDHTLINALQ